MSIDSIVTHVSTALAGGVGVKLLDLAREVLRKPEPVAPAPAPVTDTGAEITARQMNLESVLRRLEVVEAREEKRVADAVVAASELGESRATIAALRQEVDELVGKVRELRNALEESEARAHALLEENERLRREGGYGRRHLPVIE